MDRVLLAREARGDLVETLQRSLGFAEQDIDGWYGAQTETSVTAFQQSNGLKVSGAADTSTWAQATNLPIPELFERALELTADFEGHGFTLAQGNFDGAGLTWGIIGFTVASGEVSSIVQEVNQQHPECVQQAFGDLAPKLLQVMGSPITAQLQFADSLSIGAAKVRLAEPWRSGFALFGSMEPVKQTQLRHARDKYFVPASATAQLLGLKTELGVGLAFDIHVQNGGVKKTTQNTLLGQSFATERDLRVALANAVANSATPKYREDVRSRKLTLATGKGMVHGVSFTVKNWGLDEVAAA